MAVTSFEVGAIFRIVDAASPTLKALSAQITTIQGQLDKIKESIGVGLTGILSGFNTELAKMGTGAGKSAGEIETAFARIDKSAALTLGSLTALKDEVGTIALGARGALGGPGRSPAGAGGIGGRGGFTGPSVGL